MFIVQRSYDENPGGEPSLRERVVGLFDNNDAASQFVAEQEAWDKIGAYSVQVMEVNSAMDRLLEIWRHQQA